MFFASDNTAPVAPEVWAAMAAVNEVQTKSYGADPMMGALTLQMRHLFEAPTAATYLVPTGTAANALSLALQTPPWGSIFCHPQAHIEKDECGAPEFFTNGAKLVLVDGPHGKMTPESLRRTIQASGLGGVHSVQRGLVSLTNVTELGTVYQLDEVKALTRVAKEFGLPCHMDGARFANALVATNAKAADMTWRAGIDILSFGGTKNGLMGVEAVVLFHPHQAWEFELRRKRAGHLMSKHRFMSAQMQAYLQDDLWLSLAKRANDSAADLVQAMGKMPYVTFDHPTDANIIFARWPRKFHQLLHDAGAYYYLNDGETLMGGGDDILGARLVCSWATVKADIDHFGRILAGH